MTVFVPDLNETDLKKFALSLGELASGRSNAVGSVTLAVSAASTTVTPNPTGIVAAGSTPILTPMTANAATEMGNGTMYVSAVTNGSFTITHANSATTGRTFAYAILG